MDAGRKNYMCLLNECAQKNSWTLQFQLVQDTGPDHIKTFTVMAVLNGIKYPEGSGRNKKEAKQNAAKNALDVLENNETVNTEESLASSTREIFALNQANYICWVNEYSQKERLTFTAKESTKIRSIQICSYTCQYVCGDEEFPEATGNSKKEAKEAAAKLVYEILIQKPEKQKIPEENGEEEENQNIQNLITSLQHVEMSTASDTGTTSASDHNYIGRLNEYCQKTEQVYNFEPVQRRGPAHNPEFVYTVVIGNKKFPEGQGKNKQEAKQKAAQLALLDLHDSSFSSQISSPSSMSCSQNISSTQSKSESVVFANSVPKPSDVKPKRQLAANFLNSPVNNKQKSNMNELKSPTPLTKSPIDSTPPKSRFLEEFHRDSISKIGRGGQGRVFKAKRILEDIIYAVKIVKLTTKSLKEVTALSRLTHPNIVRYYTSWDEDTEYKDDTQESCSSSTSDGGSRFLYIQMEFCEGETLRKWIHKMNNDPDACPERRGEAEKIIKQILEAVNYIHLHFLIHRDLKPENIMFGNGRGVKVVDFGLVTEDEGEDDEKLLERSRRAGTNSYMSPEQKNPKNYDRKVDIYPLGLIYFELLWRFGTTYERSLNWDKIRSKNFPEQFSSRFDFEHKLIEEMLSEKPEKRPEASDLLQKLKQYKATAVNEHNEYK